MTARILVVDDRESDRKKLCEILSGQSYELLEAESCETALELCARKRPDLIIADDASPEKAGHMLCSALRDSPNVGTIPVILLSGWTIPSPAHDGHDISVADFISRPINRSEVLTRVRSQLRLQELVKSLNVVHEQLIQNQCRNEESLKSAALIQKSLVLTSPPSVSTFGFAWRFMPSDHIGGDLFNVFRMDESHLAAYILDVSGRGVPAAMVTASVAQTLSPYLGFFLKESIPRPPYYALVSPATVLEKLNSEYPIERFDKFFTLCYLLINTETGVLRYSNAAHPHPLLMRANGQVEQLREGGPIIGLGEAARYDEGETVMRPGDRLFLYTDGIVEHVNGVGEPYGDVRFLEQLRATHVEQLQTACDLSVESVLEFGSYRKPEDDIALLGLEYRPSR